MTTLERQLAEYFESQEDRYGPITPAMVTSLELTTPRRRKWQPSLVSLVTGALVVLAVAALPLLTPGGEGEPHTDVSVVTASQVSEFVEFNGEAFAIDDEGPVEAPYRVTRRSESGEWIPVDGLSFGYLPAITASADRIMVVSPGANAHWAENCAGAAIEVAVSSDGETWDTSQLDDVWDEFLKTDSTPGGENGTFPCMYGGGGDAIGPEGLLVVRRITICCVNPDQYPHFWFSPNGADWQRVTLSQEMLWGDTSPTRWGSPKATPKGFSIEVERFVDEDENYIETWESADGLFWNKTDERRGSLPTNERAGERDSVLRFRNATQIGDSFYVLEPDGVYSSVGGELWKLDLSTDGNESTLWGASTPIVLTVDREESERQCGPTWPDRVETAVRAIDGGWTMSELPIPSIPDHHRAMGCFNISVTSVAEQPDGISVTARLTGDIDWDSMISQVLGEELASQTVGGSSETLHSDMTFDYFTFVQSVDLEDGTTVRVDLREHGYGDAIVETLTFARDQLGLPVEDPYLLGEIELVWESSDGESWTRAD